MDTCPPADDNSHREAEPPLHRAARTGDCEAIRRLVAAGEEVDSTFNIETQSDARLATPFMIAAGTLDGADVETLRVLLELGADPKKVIDGLTAATFCCEGLECEHDTGGDAERLRFVLKAGSPLPNDPERANRLLCKIAASGDVERVRMLLEHGLNPRGHWDAEKARESAAAMKRQMAAHRANSVEEFPVQAEVAQAAFAKALQEIEERTCERLGSAPSDDELPLFCAAKSGNAECVRLLLAAGADVTVRDLTKHTAMYAAGSAEVVEALVTAGLSLEDADEYGWSPLTCAVHDGEWALSRVRALINAGANVNASGDHGYTLFMSAVGSGRYPALLRLLIASGANPHAVTEYGRNAFHAAIDVNFEANAEESVRDTLGYLKELGVNIEQRDESNQTPLAWAIDSGTGLEVRVLCELGANPNAVCSKHECGGEACTRRDLPLLFHAVVGTGVDRDEKTEALLTAGANPLAQDPEGFTPLIRVVASLCQDAASAAEFEALYRSFFKGLAFLRLEGKPMPRSRESFIAEAAPFLRPYVEQFASRIPVPETSEYEAEWREERVACIILLCAFEGWDRHEYLGANPA